MKLSMNKRVSSLSIAFLGFIGWFIYLANTAQKSIFFEFVDNIPYGDKLAHFFLFGLLSLAVNFSFKLKVFMLGWFEVYAGSIFVFLFVLIEEFSQHFIPSRTMTAADLFADIMGIIVFSLITKLISKYNYR